MFKVFGSWIERYFSDEEALLLVVFLTVALIVVITLGGMLAPVFAGIIVAFLMQGMVEKLKDAGMRHTPAVSVVFVCFVSIFMALLLVVIPETWRQLVNLLNELPRMLTQGQELLMLLPERYPELVTPVQVQSVIDQAAAELGGLGQYVLSLSLSSIGNIIQLLIYLVLVPILVFFLYERRKYNSALVDLIST